MVLWTCLCREPPTVLCMCEKQTAGELCTNSPDFTCRSSLKTALATYSYTLSLFSLLLVFGSCSATCATCALSICWEGKYKHLFGCSWRPWLKCRRIVVIYKWDCAEVWIDITLLRLIVQPYYSCSLKTFCRTAFCYYAGIRRRDRELTYEDRGEGEQTAEIRSRLTARQGTWCLQWQRSTGRARTEWTRIQLQ